MALIICPECGKQISDRAPTCPNCGCPISANAEVSNTSVPTQTASAPVKKSKKSVLIAVIALVVIIAIGVGIYASRFSPKAKLEQAYAEAVELYNNGQYDEALPKFEALGDFRNSADVQKWCKYEIAKECMASSEWETAVAYLSNLNHQDSEELILDCRYNQGITAMEIFEWETAATYLSNLNYKDSERMLTDCSFMMTLADSVLRRMETTAKEASDSRSLVTTELAYLDEFRKADFFDSTIETQAKKYIGGLDKQLDGLSYEYYYEFQRDWNTGFVARCEALNKLYQDYQFMADNKDFVGEYINQLPYHQKWLSAFNELETNGHIEIKDWKYTYNYVEAYFKNNTPYTSSQYFEFIFYGDKAETKLIDSITVYVDNIGPYSEYTVRAYYPQLVQQAYYGSGFWVRWSNYYDEIKIS